MLNLNATIMTLVKLSFLKVTIQNFKSFTLPNVTTM